MDERGIWEAEQKVAMAPGFIHCVAMCRVPQRAHVRGHMLPGGVVGVLSCRRHWHQAANRRACVFADAVMSWQERRTSSCSFVSLYPTPPVDARGGKALHGTAPASTSSTRKYGNDKAALAGIKSPISASPATRVAAVSTHHLQKFRAALSPRIAVARFAPNPAARLLVRTTGFMSRKKGRSKAKGSAKSTPRRPPANRPSFQSWPAQQDCMFARLP
jgi:hypothetical protein